jgi:hypothetical protein
VTVLGFEASLKAHIETVLEQHGADVHPRVVKKVVLALPFLLSLSLSFISLSSLSLSPPPPLLSLL